ncbi:MAG TPA: hypothetical protein VKQ31_06570 [Steroidobacteraceae bacterium]|nr:hypothetical protein [Steroidobacteraceae bacterium]
MTSLDFREMTRPYVHVGHVSGLCDAADPETIGAVYARGGAHDPTRVVAALVEVEARRAALEWLLEADLLRACLV